MQGPESETVDLKRPTTSMPLKTSGKWGNPPNPCLSRGSVSPCRSRHQFADHVILTSRECIGWSVLYTASVLPCTTYTSDDTRIYAHRSRYPSESSQSLASTQAHQLRCSLKEVSYMLTSSSCLPCVWQSQDQDWTALKASASIRNEAEVRIYRP